MSIYSQLRNHIGYNMESRVRTFLLVGVLATFLKVVAGATTTTVPFTFNYLASTDATHTRVLNGGQHVDLALDQLSAAAFGSKGAYLYGSIGMGIKLVPGNSAGTVTAYYLSSPGAQHDEMDFEFLGNLSSQPYILQTNVFAKGVGGREQRINLWFDPTADYHTYSLLWNKNIIIFFVDATPIRAYRNSEDLGVPFPNSQGVGIYASLWDGSSWATQGGNVPLDWTAAPFVASFEGFGLDACAVVGNNVNACNSAQNWWDAAGYQTLTANQIGSLQNVHSKYIVYDYCTDAKRYPTAPAECARNWYQ